MSDIERYGMLIDGVDVAGADESLLDVVNPYDGSVWAQVPAAGGAEVDAAVRAASEAFEDGRWSGLLPAERGRLLRAFGDCIDANVDTLTSLQVRENGKAIREQSAQTRGLSAFLTYFAGLAEVAGGDTIPVSARDAFAYTVREPIGVVACLTPWNSPLALLMWKLAPALAAGNTVVIKPSEVTPVSTIMLARLALDAGIPPGVVNVVTGAAETGSALVAHPAVRKIAFTGSTAVGRRIGAVAGERLVSASLELGGKSPNIVFDDADVTAAVEGVVGGVFAAAGQTCIAGSRVLVQRSIYDDFCALLTERAARIRLGDPMDWDTEVGTIASELQHERVMSCIQTATDEGARLLLGGARPTRPALAQGLFIEPTIFADVTADMSLAREEVFGPVVAVMPFDDEEHAARLANASSYGLAAGVWSADVRRIHRMVPRLQAGTVWVNTYRKTNYATPFGGVKDSGIGRENGRHALNEFTEEKLVWIDYGTGIADPFNPFG